MRNQSGDPGAKRFAEVVQPHLGDGLALARWLTGSPTDAEDVTQEACIRALAGIDGFRGGSAKAWLLAIVRNCAWTWLRRNRPQQLVLTADPATQAVPVHEALTPESQLIAAQSQAKVAAALAALPLIYREIIVLRDVNGLSYRDIAGMLALPTGTVMSRLARGRAELRKLLKDE